MKKNLEGEKLLFKIGLFSLPIIVLFAIELLVLPIDFFTLRPWETLIVQNVKVMDGPFYPNKQVHQVATGEIAPHTRYAVPKPEYWVTDKYGYRNRVAYKSPEVVLIGDSFVAGATLSQPELLSETLERKLNEQVYSFAPADPGFLTPFLLDKRFKNSPPEVVVFCRAERWLPDLPVVNENSLKEVIKAKAGPVVNEIPVITNLVVTLDRIIKWPLYNYFRAKLDRSYKHKELNLHHGELFLYGDSINNEVPIAQIKRISDIIQGYSDVVKARGMRFVFLPVPNKESIYYQLLPSKKQATFLPQLFAELNARGVEFIDLQQPYMDAYYNQRIPLYPKDDNHWNKNGVQIAADLLYEKINSRNINDLAINQ